ncbi:MAG TPA: sigma-70 family RNA polymerase sigma factor [Blastocatellia bacterium]|nr:sigma-70 family RNA polymerase sigma factor [Blastocatellia bacterium]
MTSIKASEFTSLLIEWRQGNQAARDEVFAMVYQELRRLAQYYLRQERPNHTLQPTALVNEVYLRLFGATEIEWKDRVHFFRVAGRQMRRILVDYGRAGRAEKRDGRKVMLHINESQGITWQRSEDLLALDEALNQLEQIAPRASEIVELRFLCGFDEKETAEALEISISTLKRDWAFAKGFIYRQLTGAESEGEHTESQMSLSTTTS